MKIKILILIGIINILLGVHLITIKSECSDYFDLQKAIESGGLKLD